MGNCCSACTEERHVTLSEVKQRDTKAKQRRSKGAGASPNGKQNFREFEEEFDTNMDLWTDVGKFESDTEEDDEDFESDNITLKRKGKTKELFKKEFMDKIVKHCSDKVQSSYNELGPFKYR